MTSQTVHHRLMDFRERYLRSYWMTKVTRFAAILLWNILHFLVTIWYWVNDVYYTLESYLITCGFFKKYRYLDPSKVKYLAIVIESEEAYQISEVIELLHWVTAIGVKHVCLYDMEGVLKESQETIIDECNARPRKAVETDEAVLKPSQLILEFISVSDGKEGVVKAANLLFSKYKDGNGDKTKFTEPIIDEALQLVGCSGPEPDLLLIYGPARCHLGFPPWRLSYTEIVHMGNLKSKKYGSLIKAIYRFTTVRQNYGT
ncbi:dehydrodolichyl diphosphate synthase complex subunit NUS1-like [Chenopodium quinoa]|uniref:dehydrodolichyl diphosphate synthase complex subunit NUS1-like n=1 Tax=Chenopodium quinoa TaxID=63459 RepID=UPI000B790CEF|nr:dehydrodolichyl diphosphate synthase complex subunit NUS1-like [Chenopodium quinoa]